MRHQFLLVLYTKCIVICFSQRAKNIPLPKLPKLQHDKIFFTMISAYVVHNTLTVKRWKKSIENGANKNKLQRINVWKLKTLKYLLRTFNRFIAEAFYSYRKMYFNIQICNLYIHFQYTVKVRKIFLSTFLRWILDICKKMIQLLFIYFF